MKSEPNSKPGLGLAQAFRTLTILPAPGPDARCQSTQLYFYPLVGLVISSIFIAILYLLPSTAALLLGFLWPAYMAFITRGFHLDGLADTADGFGGGWTIERRLEIMKDSRTGSFGVIAITLCLLLKGILAFYVIDSHYFIALIWSCLVSRTLVVFTCTISKYAKPQGLSYNLVYNAKAKHTVATLLFTALCGFLLVYYLDFPVKILLSSFGFSFLNCLLLLLLSNKKIGGITGDVLGAMCETCEVAALFGATLLLL